MKYRQYILLAACVMVSASAQKKDGIPPSLPSLPKSTQTKNAAILNINNIASWQSADGIGGYSQWNFEGARYPRGTGAIMYSDGFIWAGKAYKDPAFTEPTDLLLRAGGSTYNSGNRVGWIVEWGEPNYPIDPSHPRARIYRIRRDYAFMPEYELVRDAAENKFTSISAISDADVLALKAQYQTDWTEWPVDLGAPYIERNGTPGYQPPPPFSYTFTPDSLVSGHYDEPGIAGGDPHAPADQVIWFVCNDLHENTMESLFGAWPMGLEQQMTLWGYNRPDHYGSMYFKRFRLINKGGGKIDDSTRGSIFLDSVYIGQWADQDIGHWSDDLLGYDTTLSLGYAYNGKRVDDEYAQFGLPPAAAGYDWLQGPAIPSTGDTALIDFVRRPGYRNLPPTSFVYTESVHIEPPFGYEYTKVYWRMLQGFHPDPYSPFRLFETPPGIPQSRFLLTGDPVSGTGFVDGLGTSYSPLPGDRKFVLGCGPLRMAPRDTIEVIVAVVAALGGDRLSSITLLKAYDRAAQLVYDGSMSIPRAPLRPNVSAVELDQEVILEWGSPHSEVKAKEDAVIGKGIFEGYVVYQLPYPSATRREAEIVATFDRFNGVTSIVGLELDPEMGVLVPVVKQRGTDSGVKRSIRITRDLLTDGMLHNGTDYYFAVTSYNTYQSTDGLLSLENDLAPIRVRPRIPFGVSGLLTYGDTVSVAHTAGNGTGRVVPTVVDPLISTGHTYEVHFDSTSAGTVWSLRNTTRNVVLLRDMPIHAGPDDPPAVEGGLMLRVSGSFTTADVFRYTTSKIDSSTSAIDASIGRIIVYPNPTNGESWAMFSNLPRHAVIRIFSISGEQVRVLEKNDASQFLRWDLLNERNRQVASGIYLCVIEMPDLDQTKVLKLAVIQSRVYPGGW